MNSQTNETREIGKYHIFGFSDKDVNKLCAQVNKQHQAYHPANGGKRSFL